MPQNKFPFLLYNFPGSKLAEELPISIKGVEPDNEIDPVISADPENGKPDPVPPPPDPPAPVFDEALKLPTISTLPIIFKGVARVCSKAELAKNESGSL